MGCVWSKGRDTSEDLTVASGQDPKTDYEIPGGEIFFPYSESPGKETQFVDFNTKLELKAGSEGASVDQYVFQDVDPNGLAYSAGFRAGDVLREVNGDNIEGTGIDHVLDLLRHYQEPDIFLGIRRDGQPKNYIWVIFEIVKEDGAFAVEVNQTLENDEGELPLLVLVDYFAFRRKSRQKYDIYCSEDGKQFYLSIDKGKLFFQTPYRIETSSFRKYYYIGNPPNTGQVVVYSLQNLKPIKPTGESKSPTDNHSTPASTSEDELQVLDMPEDMVERGKLISSTNPRFWFEKKVVGPGEVATFFAELQSVNATTKKYLGIGGDSKSSLRPAILTEKEMVLTIAPSED